MPARKVEVEAPVKHDSLALALLAAQREIPSLVKSAENPHFGSKYIPLEAVIEAVVPVLQKHGILLMQNLSASLSGPALTTVFQYGGESSSYTVPLILEKQTPQAVGSAITYMRRYAILSALALVADADDDAEAAMTRTAKTPKKRETAPATPATPAPAVATTQPAAEAVLGWLPSPWD